MPPKTITLTSPAKLLPGDRLALEGADNEWAPPLESIDTSGDQAVLHLGEGQPGPFYWDMDQPVTVQRTT